MNECPICLEIKELASLNCHKHHQYCEDCISKITHCAICRKETGGKEIKKDSKELERLFEGIQRRLERELDRPNNYSIFQKIYKKCFLKLSYMEKLRKRDKWNRKKLTYIENLLGEIYSELRSDNMYCNLSSWGILSYGTKIINDDGKIYYGANTKIIWRGIHLYKNLEKTKNNFDSIRTDNHRWRFYNIYSESIRFRAVSLDDHSIR